MRMAVGCSSQPTDAGSAHCPLVVVVCPRSGCSLALAGRGCLPPRSPPPRAPRLSPSAGSHSRMSSTTCSGSEGSSPGRLTWMTWQLQGSHGAGGAGCGGEGGAHGAGWAAAGARGAWGTVQPWSPPCARGQRRVEHGTPFGVHSAGLGVAARRRLEQNVCNALHQRPHMICSGGGGGGSAAAAAELTTVVAVAAAGRAVSSGLGGGEAAAWLHLPLMGGGPRATSSRCPMHHHAGQSGALTRRPLDELQG